MLGFTEMFLRNYSSFNFFNCCDLCCLFKIGINPWDQTVFCSFVLSLCYNGFSLNVWKVMYSRPFLCLWQNSRSFHWGHISAHWERFCCIGELLDHVEIIVLENGIWEKNIRKECLRSSWKPEIRKEHRNKHGPLQKLWGKKKAVCTTMMLATYIGRMLMQYPSTPDMKPHLFTWRTNTDDFETF